MKDILKNILTIAATKGTNAKQDMMRELESEDLKRVFEYALNPYKMYGVKVFHIGQLMHDDMTEERPDELFFLLDRLASRKLTGHAAKEECDWTCARFRIPPELLLMILNKDLRCGVAATTVNKTWPGLIPEFKVALAEEYDPEADGPWLGSIKYDGLRCIALIDEEDIKLYTRNGLEITSAEHIKPGLAKHFPSGTMLDGELLNPTGHFQDTSGSVRKKSEQDESLHYFIFDWLPLQEFQNRTCSLTQLGRWQHLEVLALNIGHDEPLTIVWHNFLTSDAMVQNSYKFARDIKKEGLILKDPNAPYSFRRNKSWMKLKDMVTVDVRVTGMEEGKGRLKGTMGKLIVDFEGKPNKVGSGFSDLERARYWDSPHHIVGKLIEVLYHEKTKDGNMRHSRFSKERWDKE